MMQELNYILLYSRYLLTGGKQTYWSVGAYAELKKVRDELRDLTVHKANYEEFRDLEEREKRKKEHGRK